MKKPLAITDKGLGFAAPEPAFGFAFGSAFEPAGAAELVLSERYFFPNSFSRQYSAKRFFAFW